MKAVLILFYYLQLSVTPLALTVATALLQTSATVDVGLLIDNLAAVVMLSVMK